ncbi:MAG: hypothetical protein LBG82_06960 [Clostridiales Family XIII bacterium]|jgi:hypothetical protein|nr:hypothetical protein [Clostridiales Family XIII bacterium]
MKKILSVIFIVLAMCSMPIAALADGSENYAVPSGKITNVVYQNDGSYFVTTIAETKSPALRASTTTKTSSKITTYYGSSGNTLWYVKVTGTFSYNGSTSSCTASTVTAAAPASNWSISSTSASKSGNQATASATANRYNGLTVVQTVSRTVTLTCSSNGTLS